MGTTTGYRSVAANQSEAASYSYWLRLIDIKVTPLSDEEVALVTADAIRAGRHLVIANHNLHSMYLSLRDPETRSFYESASYVHIDGMGLILLANSLGIRLRRVHRATSLDFMPLLFPMMVREGWRLFYLGGKPGIAESGAEALRTQYPGLQIRTHHGYLAGDEMSKVIRKINEYQPNILMIGMGMPLQEKWIQRHRGNVNANVIFPVGAYMDYQATAIPMAPRWLASLYLEWLYRLVTEPRRLWHRYLVEPWWLAGGLVRHSLRHKGRLIEVGSAFQLDPSGERAGRIADGQGRRSYEESGSMTAVTQYEESVEM